MKKINLKGVSPETWVRTGILILALFNQAFVILGISKKQIDPESWASIASYALTVLTSLWSWWKNNSFTDKAQKADHTLKE